MWDFIPSKAYKSLVKQGYIFTDCYIWFKILLPINLKYIEFYISHNILHKNLSKKYIESYLLKI